MILVSKTSTKDYSYTVSDYIPFVSGIQFPFSRKKGRDREPESRISEESEEPMVPPAVKLPGLLPPDPHLWARDYLVPESIHKILSV